MDARKIAMHEKKKWFVLNQVSSTHKNNHNHKTGFITVFNDENICANCAHTKGFSDACCNTFCPSSCVSIANNFHCSSKLKSLCQFFLSSSFLAWAAFIRTDRILPCWKWSINMQKIAASHSNCKDTIVWQKYCIFRSSIFQVFASHSFLSVVNCFELNCWWRCK